jgi:CHAD domain-containing protein
MSLESSLTRELEKFEALSRKACRDPTPDRVHDLRVVTRKLRSDFSLVPKGDRTRAIRKSRDDLSLLAEVLGEQRKYDVALEDAARFKQGTRKIEKRLKTARTNVVAVLKSDKRERYVAHLRKAIQDCGQLSPRLFAPRIARLQRSLVKTMRHPPRSDPARHRLRIAIKKARYILEAFDHDIAGLNALQEHLGRWHDLMVLAAMSGHPKELVDARERQWRLAEKDLHATLPQTVRALSRLARR